MENNNEILKGKFVILVEGDYIIKNYMEITNPTVQYLDNLDSVCNEIRKIREDTELSNSEKCYKLKEIMNDNSEILEGLVPFYIDDLSVFETKSNVISDLKVYKIDESY